MDKVLVRKARENDKEAIVSCVLEGFAVDFAPFVLIYGKTCVEAFMRKVIQLDRFFVAEKNSTVIGVMCLSDAKGRAVSGASQVAKSSFNWLKAKLASWGLSEYEERLPFDEETGFIEFVAVHPDYRRQGVATEMIIESMALTHYKHYVLDVKDINRKAIDCYEKLAFKETGRKKAGITFEKGFKEKIYMSRPRPTS